MTRDIDLVVEIDANDVDTIVEIFGRDCFLDAVKDLDLEYLQRWAAELEVGESLERLREQ